MLDNLEIINKCKSDFGAKVIKALFMKNISLILIWANNCLILVVYTTSSYTFNNITVNLFDFIQGWVIKIDVSSLITSILNLVSPNFTPWTGLTLRNRIWRQKLRCLKITVNFYQIKNFKITKKWVVPLWKLPANMYMT